MEPEQLGGAYDVAARLGNGIEDQTRRRIAYGKESRTTSSRPPFGSQTQTWRWSSDTAQ